MAILGYKDIFQYGAGVLDPWNNPITLEVAAGSSGSAVGTAPVSNLFVPALGKVWQRTGVAAAGNVQLRITTVEISGYPDFRTKFGAFGILGIKQTPATKFEGFEQDINFRLRISNLGHANGNLYDQTRTFHARESGGTMPRQVWFNIIPSDTDPAVSASGGNPAIVPVAADIYYTIDISLADTALTNSYTLQIGRIVAMTTMAGRFEPTPGRSFDDTTEVLRSYGGQPYVLKGASLRRMQGAFVGLPDQAITGAVLNETGSTLSWPSSVAAANLMAGTRGEVVLIPQTYGTAGRTVSTATRYPSAWQTQPIFGLLENGIVARRDATTDFARAPSNPNGSLWRAEFAVTEIPLVI
jgi:hypothetical protein